MRPGFLFRKVHKWLALLIGIQIVFWVLSGLYMTVIPLDRVHGDHLVKPVPRAQLSALDWRPLAAAEAGSPGPVSRIDLLARLGEPVYRLKTQSGTLYLNGRDGSALEELNEEQVRRLAAQYYAFDREPDSVRRLEKYPDEIGGGDKPVWAARFDSWLDHTLYFDVMTGRLISKRSDIWRGFDFLWMLHIMDYETRSDVNNNLLKVAAGTGFLFSLAGLLLLFYSFRNRRSGP